MMAAENDGIRREGTRVTVVIAAYDEAANIGSLTARLIQTLDSMEGTTWRLIYVIEGSDKTLDIARSFASERREITVLYGPQRRGLGAAFREGFTAVPKDTDVVVTMDADLNHQPEEIPALVRALEERGADIIIGSRKVRGSEVRGMPMWKGALSDVVNHAMRRLMSTTVADQTSGFRAYRYHSLQRLPFRNAGFAFLPEILLRARALNMRVEEVPIRFVFRVAGKSKMKLAATARSYLDLFLHGIST